MVSKLNPKSFGARNCLRSYLRPPLNVRGSFLSYFRHHLNAKIAIFGWATMKEGVLDVRPWTEPDSRFFKFLTCQRHCVQNFRRMETRVRDELTV